MAGEVEQIVREPGVIFVPGHGKVQIWDFKEGSKYDSNVIPVGALAWGTPYQFFTNVPGNKQLIDCNIQTPGKLNAGEEMLVQKVGFFVHTNIGNQYANSATIKCILENAYLQIWVNNLPFMDGPVLEFPTGEGVYGMTTDVNTSVMSNGIPSMAAIKKLKVPQFLNQQYDFRATVSFPDRAVWTAAAGVGAIGAVTTGQIACIKVKLMGLIKHAAVK